MGTIPENTIEKCPSCGRNMEPGHGWYCKKGKMKYKDTKTGKEREIE